jgi:hypothetical protein
MAPLLDQFSFHQKTTAVDRAQHQASLQRQPVSHAPKAAWPGSMPKAGALAAWRGGHGAMRVCPATSRVRDVRLKTVVCERMRAMTDRDLVPPTGTSGRA